jgi:hypothetical protein
VPGPWPRFATLEDGAVPIILKRVFARDRYRRVADQAPHEGQHPCLVRKPQRRRTRSASTKDALTHSPVAAGMGDDGLPASWSSFRLPKAVGTTRASRFNGARGANLARAFQRSLDAAFLDSEDGGSMAATTSPIRSRCPSRRFRRRADGGIPPACRSRASAGRLPDGRGFAQRRRERLWQVWRREAIGINASMTVCMFSTGRSSRSRWRQPS